MKGLWPKQLYTAGHTCPTNTSRDVSVQSDCNNIMFIYLTEDRTNGIHNIR